jgi:hypothetical protein
MVFNGHVDSKNGRCVLTDKGKMAFLLCVHSDDVKNFHMSSKLPAFGRSKRFCRIVDIYELFLPVDSPLKSLQFKKYDGGAKAAATTWECYKCNAIVPYAIMRCSVCKSWKNGKRPDTLHLLHFYHCRSMMHFLFRDLI